MARPTRRISGPGEPIPRVIPARICIHYMYVDDAETNTYGGLLLGSDDQYRHLTSTSNNSPPTGIPACMTTFNFIAASGNPKTMTRTRITSPSIGPDGFTKPAAGTEQRGTIGSIQTALTAVNNAQDKLRGGVCGTATGDKQSLDQAVLVFNAQNAPIGRSTDISDDIATRNRRLTPQRMQNVINMVAATAGRRLMPMALIKAASRLPTTVIAGAGRRR